MKSKQYEFIVEAETIKDPKRYKLLAKNKNKELYTIASLRNIDELLKEIKEFILEK
jgi:hypothetical protein